MKNTGMLFFAFLFFAAAYGQSVGINSSGLPPHSSAILDVRSSNKGLLVPRVFLNNIFDSITIQHPAVSLLVFNINPALDGGSGFYAWNGNNWLLMMSATNSFVRGKNRFLTVVDGDAREYFVHVPKRYDGTTKVPVVFMLHGTSGDGEKFYNESGWVEVSEDENIITVFPSSWRYCIVDGGVVKNTTKWNTTPDAEWVFCAGQTPRDDIKFLKRMITELKAKFSVDTAKMYLEGFSNGGQMAAKCTIEMSDVFAAIVENAGSFYLDTTYTPKRKLPVLFEIGNGDWGPGNPGPFIPISYLNQILDSTFPVAQVNARFNRPANRHVRYFGLNPNYNIIGDTSSLVVGLYTGLSGHPLNVFRYVFVDDLRHAYPDGSRHWLEAARYHWAWMKQYQLP
ncbi:MAG: prolyl oligopeptidase family serine peptidase [Bacteroidota bacterium]